MENVIDKVDAHDNKNLNHEYNIQYETIPLLEPFEIKSFKKKYLALILLSITLFVSISFNVGGSALVILKNKSMNYILSYV